MSYSSSEDGPNIIEFVPEEYQDEVTLFLASENIQEYYFAGNLPYHEVVKFLCFKGARGSAESKYWHEQKQRQQL